MVLKFLSVIQLNFPPGNSYEAGPYEYSDYCMLFNDEDSYPCQDIPTKITDSNNLYLER